MIESTQVLVPVPAAPELVTVHPTVTVAGSPTVSAGAITFETARSGYGASATFWLNVAVPSGSTAPVLV